MIIKITPVPDLPRVMAIYGMLLPVTAAGAPIFNLIYQSSLDFRHGSRI